MDKRRNHIIFWVGYCIYYFMSMYGAYKDTASFELIISRNLYILLSILFLFYFLINIIFPHTISQKRYYLLLLEILCLGVFLLFIYHIIFYYLSISYPTKIPAPTILTGMARVSMVIERSFYLAAPFWFFKNYISEIQQTLMNEKKQYNFKQSMLNAELMGLKNQINPHFFYNILNFLYSHALSFTTELSRAILILSDMMRYAIRENNEQRYVSLEEEVIYIQNYIQLENLQYSKNRNVHLTVNGNFQYRRIIPLTLQPILDFSYKYGNEINFNLDIKENQVFFVSHFNNNDNVKSMNDHFMYLNLKKTNNCAYSLSTELDKFKIELQVKL
jgi:two-component system, LytTR family, sensor kinase